MQVRPRSMWRRAVRKVRTIFIAGLLVVVPVGLTAWIVVWIFNSVENMLQPLVRTALGRNIPGVAFGITVAFIFIVGVIVTNVVGRRVVRFGESLLGRVPIVRPLYLTLREIFQSFSESAREKFMQVVLVEFPAKGMRTVGFVTNEDTDISGQKVVTVFIPTAPNPTTGFIQVLHEKDIIRTQMSVEDGLKMVVSAGRIAPKGLGDEWLTGESAQRSRMENSVLPAEEEGPVHGVDDR